MTLGFPTLPPGLESSYSPCKAQLKVVSSGTALGQPGFPSLPQLAMVGFLCPPQGLVPPGPWLPAPGQAGGQPAARPLARGGLYLDDYGQPSAPILVGIHALFPDPQAVRVRGPLCAEEGDLAHDSRAEREAGAAPGRPLLDGGMWGPGALYSGSERTRARARARPLAAGWEKCAVGVATMGKWAGLEAGQRVGRGRKMVRWGQET
jgi:hypothetical protein